MPLGDPPPKIHNENKHNSQIPAGLIKPRKRRYPVCLDGNILTGNWKPLPTLWMYHMHLNYFSWNCNKVILSFQQPLWYLLIKPQRTSAKLQTASVEVQKILAEKYHVKLTVEWVYAIGYFLRLLVKIVQTYKRRYIFKITAIKYFWGTAQQQQENYILSFDYGLQHLQIMFFSYRIRQMHNLLHFAV